MLNEKCLLTILWLVIIRQYHCLVIRGDIIYTSQITNTFDMIQVDTTVLQKASRQKKPLIYEV